MEASTDQLIALLKAEVEDAPALLAELRARRDELNAEIKRFSASMDIKRKMIAATIPRKRKTRELSSKQGVTPRAIKQAVKSGDQAPAFSAP
jgi:hypothetical protein